MISSSIFTSRFIFCAQQSETSNFNLWNVNNSIDLLTNLNNNNNRFNNVDPRIKNEDVSFY